MASLMASASSVFSSVSAGFAASQPEVCISSSKVASSTARFFLQPSVGGVPDNLQEPGAAVGAMESVERLKGTQIGFLHNILRIVFIAQQAIGPGYAPRPGGATSSLRMTQVRAPGTYLVLPAS